MKDEYIRDIVEAILELNRFGKHIEEVFGDESPTKIYNATEKIEDVLIKEWGERSGFGYDENDDGMMEAYAEFSLDLFHDEVWGGTDEVTENICKGLNPFGFDESLKEKEKKHD